MLEKFKFLFYRYLLCVCQRLMAVAFGSYWKYRKINPSERQHSVFRRSEDVQLYKKLLSSSAILPFSMCHFRRIY